MEDDFVEDVETGCFDTASSGTRHATDKHEEEHEHLGSEGPEVVVGGDKAGGGLEGKGLEATDAEGLHEGIDVLEEEVEGDEEAADEGSGEEEDKVGDVDAGEFEAQSLEVEGEVDAACEHEEEDDPFGGDGVVATDAVVAYGEAAGGDVAEGDAKGIEKGHLRVGEEEEGDFGDGEGEVEFPEERAGLSDAGTDPFFDGAAGFDLVEEFTANLQGGKDGEEDDDDAETADPLEEASPKEDGFGDSFDARVEDEVSGRVADGGDGAVVGIGLFGDVRVGDVDGDFLAGGVVSFGAHHRGAGGGEPRHGFEVGV